jgi:hypothetical protein
MKDLHTIRDMSRLFDIRDVLHLSSRKKTIVCPLPQHVHKHRTPSFSIFTTPNGQQKWKCFGSCGLGGDILDLVGFMEIPGYQPKNGDDVKRAISLLSGGVRINPPQQQTTKAPELNNGLYKLYLPAGDAVREYAKGRGLTPETLEKFSVGQNTTSVQWMTMPAIHGSRLRGIKMRNLQSRSKKDRFISVPGSIDGLFGFNYVDGTIKSVAIVKGEIPVMLLSQFGILACAPTGGEGSYHKHEELLTPLAFAKKRIVIGDNDEDPGVRAKMTLAARKRAEIFRAEMFQPPDPYVGVDDWVLAKPDEALPAIQRWLS